MLLPAVTEKVSGRINPRWLSLKLLDYDDALMKELNTYLGCDILADTAVTAALDRAKTFLSDLGVTRDDLKDRIVSSVVKAAEDVCRGAIRFEKATMTRRTEKLIRFLLAAGRDTRLC